MKGDAFLEMAARCGDLPDSVMTVPRLEYVGEKAAQWETLDTKAMSWTGANPNAELDPVEFRAFFESWARMNLSDTAETIGLFGLALFARLMAIVIKERT